MMAPKKSVDESGTDGSKRISFDSLMDCPVAASSSTTRWRSSVTCSRFWTRVVSSQYATVMEEEGWTLGASTAKRLTRQ